MVLELIILRNMNLSQKLNVFHSVRGIIFNIMKNLKLIGLTKLFYHQISYKTIDMENS